MTGTKAFLFQLGFTLFPLLFIFGGLHLMKTYEKRRRLRVYPKSGHGCLMVALAGLIMAFLVVRFFGQVYIHVSLGGTESHDVEYMQVYDVKISEPEDLERMSEAIRDNQWFMSNRRSRNRQGILLIRHKNGEEELYPLYYYRQKNGAWITISSGSGGSGWRYGAIFFPRLPEALNEIGVPFPRESDKDG